MPLGEYVCLRGGRVFGGSPCVYIEGGGRVSCYPVSGLVCVYVGVCMVGSNPLMFICRCVCVDIQHLCANV